MLTSLTGCTPLGTLHTPDVTPPGHVTLALGGTIVPAKVEASLANHTETTLIGLPWVYPELAVRVGLPRRLEIGLRTAGVTGLAGEVKMQVLEDPLRVALLGGTGRGKAGFYFDDYAATATYGGFLVGTQTVYGGVLLVAYAYDQTTYYECGDKDCGPDEFHYERLIPTLTLGLTGQGRNRGVVELHATAFPRVSLGVSAGWLMTL